MRILLTTLNAKYIHINLAIRLLFELNKDKQGLAWKEFTIKEDKAGIADFCKDFEIVAFSCYIWNIQQTLEVARLIKLINKDIKILLGGPEVSYEYNDVICLDEVDYIITGEGETPFKEFINNYPNIENVPNLVFKKDGKVKENLPAPMFDLTNYTNFNPYINDKPEDLYNKVCYVETSRGCPYKCEFCLASLDNKVRTLPIDDIKTNLLYLMEHGRVVKFLDRTFNVKKDFTIDIFKFILSNHKPHNVFQFEITADIVHPDIVQFIQEHVPKGLFRFEIGIQTVNQQANLQVSRKQNFDKTSAVIKTLDNKIEMHLDLIVGLPLDYWNDIKYSIEEVFKLFPPELQLGFLKFLKGTPMRHKYLEHNYVYDPLPPYQIIKSKYLSEEELLKITVLEEALEIYWNKKRAFHTLKYVSNNYSIFDFLLGLGNLFESKSNFHKHALVTVYEIINEYAKTTYPNDKILLDLIAIDYYLHPNIKPKTLFIEEIERAERISIIERLRLNHHKFRFIIIPINIDFEIWQQSETIVEGNYHLIFQYNGTTKPDLVFEKLEMVNV